MVRIKEAAILTSLDFVNIRIEDMMRKTNPEIAYFISPPHRFSARIKGKEQDAENDKE